MTIKINRWTDKKTSGKKEKHVNCSAVADVCQHFYAIDVLCVLNDNNRWSTQHRKSAFEFCFLFHFLCFHRCNIVILRFRFQFLNWLLSCASAQPIVHHRLSAWIENTWHLISSFQFLPSTIEIFRFCFVRYCVLIPGKKKLSTDNHKWHLVNSFYSFSHFFLVSFHAAFVCLQSSRFILENTVISDIFSDQKKEIKRNFDNRRVVIVKRHRYKSINSFTLSLELFLFWRDHFIFKSHLKGPRKLKQN